MEIPLIYSGNRCNARHCRGKSMLTQFCDECSVRA